ncbi:MAG: EAL domain-containing protein [Clostridia bacterium]|nr:EAL domain-containing protein [Clostridia bacterium]
MRQLQRRLGAAALALLLGLMTGLPARAEETVLIAGNDGLYPIESYDPKTERYVGLLPELYERIGRETGLRLVYLPHEGDTGQRQRTENRQADILSAYLPDTVDERLLRERITVCRRETAQGVQEIRVGFLNTLSPETAETLKQALQAIPPEETLGLLANSLEANRGVSRRRFFAALAALGGMTLLAALALGLFLRQRQSAVRERVGAVPRLGIGGYQAYLRRVERTIPPQAWGLYYVACIGCGETLLEQRLDQSRIEQLERCAAAYLKRACGQREGLYYVARGSFALILRCGSRERAERRMAVLMEELNTQLTGVRREYAGLIRAGVCALGEERSLSGETALSHALQGRRDAEARGLSYAFTTPQLIAAGARQERLRRRCAEAVVRGELTPYLQLVMDRQGRVNGAELLSRWQEPEEGLLRPGEYLDLMIASGVIVRHDLEIFRMTCRLLEQWSGLPGREKLRLACNFTRAALAEPGFAEQVRRIAAGASFPREQLILEITEDTLIRSEGAVRENILELTAMGFCMALDDLGAGYSSLEDLCAYPIQFVKLARELVRRTEEERGRRLVAGLCRLAHSMDMQVLCEGVETREQLETVLEQGCDLIQGFYYARPLPLREAERRLQEMLGKA